MRKYVKLADGQELNISPITYQEFMILNLWTGASDMAWEAFLRRNGFEDPRDYRDETLKGSVFLIDQFYSVNELEFARSYNDDGEYIWERYSQILETVRIEEQRLFRGTWAYWKEENEI